MPSRSLADGLLFTDQYQLTMSQVYFRMGLHENEAQFEHYFRRYPDYGSHQAGFCIAAGLDSLLEWMDGARITEDELAALRSQVDGDGRRVFDDDFLGWLAKNGHFDGLSVRAMQEGRVVHANAPFTVVTGPLAMAQILETSLLNHLNFETLIATKASRVCEASRGRPVLEFGLRRSAGKGANAAARAALVGGAAATSNVGMSHVMGVQPKGTHAHALVQVFMSLGQGELGAFRAFAEVYPDDCLLLVDTIDTLGSGVPNAITVFDELRSKGHEPAGIRLDSGDLAYLAIRSAVQLNEAGYENTSIVLSSSLDELVIFQILAQIDQEAPRYGLDPEQLIRRLVMGVGSKLATSDGHPYLDGVYKLMALRGDASSDWSHAIKVSETPAKTPNPGDKNVVRVYDNRGYSTADVLVEKARCIETELFDPTGELELRHPIQPHSRRVLHQEDVSEVEQLLEPVVEQGTRVGDPADLQIIASRRTADIERLDPGVRRLVNPHRYHVSLTQGLWDLKQDLVAQARAGEPTK